MHISEQEENTQVDFKAESDLQTARENDSSRGGRDLGWKSSVCHKVPLLILEDPEDPCKSGGAGEGHRCPAWPTPAALHRAGAHGEHGAAFPGARGATCLCAMNSPCFAIPETPSASSSQQHSCSPGEKSKFSLTSPSEEHGMLTVPWTPGLTATCLSVLQAKASLGISTPGS